MKSVTTYQIAIDNMVKTIEDEILLKRIYQYIMLIYLRQGG